MTLRSLLTARRTVAGAPGFRIIGVTRNSRGETTFVTITSAQLHHRVTLDVIG
ncbi:hypothetical protein [Streptomyces cinereoruber]|uniref:hypothetical protein n=1 Tax=Streptomyces cinereoruber TaxID=67260 RepID=UPI003638689F